MGALALQYIDSNWKLSLCWFASSKTYFQVSETHFHFVQMPVSLISSCVYFSPLLLDTSDYLKLV